MVGLKMRHIRRDILILFILCYEYKLNFNQVMKLYEISKKYFWTFLEVVNNMTKVGARKALNVRNSANKILNSFKTEDLKGLSLLESSIKRAFEWYIEDNFTDGESCLNIKQIEMFPFAKGYNAEENRIVSNSYEDIKKNLDFISYLKVGDTCYYKTTKVVYYLEKFAGNLNIKELNNLSITDVLDKIEESKKEYESIHGI